MEIEWTPENEIFEENSEKCQIFKEFPFKINETKTGMKQIVSGLKRTEKGKRGHVGPTFNFNKKKLIKQKQLNQFRRTEG